MYKNTLALLILSAIATPVLADNTGGYYLAADFGRMAYSNTNPGGTDFTNPSAFRISGGYRFSPTFALEGGYAALADATQSSGSSSATLKNSALQMAAVGTLLAYDQFELFGKLGVSVNSIRASGTGSLSGLNTSHSTSFSSILGIGVQYNVNKQFGIRAQYEKFAGFSVENNSQSWNVHESLPSLGVVYKF
jgi:OOP family OmpA-OmpF porin